MNLKRELAGVRERLQSAQERSDHMCEALIAAGLPGFAQVIQEMRDRDIIEARRTIDYLESVTQ